MSGGEADRLGEKLLAEVQVTDWSAVLKALRAETTSGGQSHDEASTESTSYFHIPELDALIHGSDPPVLELVSPPGTYQPSGSGKTSLLYLIVAMAILPQTVSSVRVDGHAAAVVLFDPLSHFSAARLAQVTLHVLKSKLHAAADVALDAAAMKAVVQNALHHAHIFRPSSWPSLLSTLRCLPAYLFDGTKHASTPRRVHALVVEDTDALLPSIRSTNTAGPPQALASASSTLTFQLTRLATLLACAVVLTSRSASPRYYRPALPASWPRDTRVIRLALRRVPVRKFAAGISVDEAEAERAKRWEAVSRARFECWTVGVGDGGSNGGFVFRVGAGVDMERAR